MKHLPQYPGQQPGPEASTLVLPLTVLDNRLFPLVGGKAANLGALMHAGFSVPDGFCVTTAAYTRLADLAELDPLLSELEGLAPENRMRQAELATFIRRALCQTSLPSDVRDAVTAAYQTLSEGGAPIAVSVRSSATTEDLPDASFAGQQETVLNVIGVEAVLAALQRCFASLWTDRAMLYRADLGIAPREARLAVVVQRMVEAQVAGVLFTANPLSGTRHQAVIDANPGLGEAVVAGLTNPDHFVVESDTGTIIKRHLGEKQWVVRARPGGGTERIEQPARRENACLSDEEVTQLSTLGAAIEAHFGTPQDIEWAFDASGRLSLLQTRPITTLFPLPDGSSLVGSLRVYLAFGVQQGTYQPYTPMGLSIIRLLGSALLSLMGRSPSDPFAGPDFLTEATCRPFFDVTAALRNTFGRRLLAQGMQQAEVHAQEIFLQLADDPRLSLLPFPRLAFLRALTLFLARTRIPWHLLWALLWPNVASARVTRFIASLNALSIEESTTADASLAAVRRLVFQALPRLLRTATPAMLAGMFAFEVGTRLLGTLATEPERQVILRGSPSNPTTAMTQALWTLAQIIRSHPEIAHLVQQTPQERLVNEYHANHLPTVLQQGLATFLAAYGHRSVNELDAGVSRWSEDPAYVLGLLASYQQVRDLVHSPQEQYQRASEEARTMITTLVSRVRRVNWLRGVLAEFFLRRAHLLAGMREMPRSCASLLLAQARRLLWNAGEALARSGRMARPDDLFFLTLAEVQETQAREDLHERITERRLRYIQEQRRRHVPLVLLSDGTEPMLSSQGRGDAATLWGTPVSPGVVTGLARVVLDPHHAHLEPGEILVAPSTDPGWTPLFLQASGLVMDLGGVMAHGAIVAREYGLPAVVGVSHATERIATGSRITVDGTTGTIVMLSASEE